MTINGRISNAGIPRIDIPAQHPGLSRADVYAFVEAWSMQRKRVSLDDYLGWSITPLATETSAEGPSPDPHATTDRYQNAS